MSDFKTRLAEEKHQIDERIEKLSLFVGTEMFNSIAVNQRVLLRIQLTAMKTYQQVLKERIEDLV